MIIHLHVMQYLGCPHYWGQLRWRDADGKRGELDVLRVLTAGQAKTLNIRQRGPNYRAGQSTRQFDWEEQLIEKTIEVFGSRFSPGHLLVLGRIEACGPQKILVGPEDLKAIVNPLWEQAEVMGWWGNKKNGKAMDALMDQYDEAVKEWAV